MKQNQDDVIHQEQDAIERAYLENVLENIQESLKSMDEELSGNRRELAEAQRQVWEDETQLVRTFDDVVTLSQIQQEYGTAQARIYDKLREYRMLRHVSDAPYFGRVDFVEKDFVEAEDDALPVAPAEVEASEHPTCAVEPGEQAEAFYIGPASIDRAGTRQRLVYDWRTPIASLFYEQGLGYASYRCPTGVMQGKLVLKRQYGIEDGKLKYWFDTDTKINDELLGLVLAESATTHLKTIVKSIQREQNLAIRADVAQDLLVIGPAGSGKTSVGMHRCAWLLYHYRERVTATNLLVISSSGIFADYVSGVLPELGERELRRTVFSSLLQPLIPEGFEAEDRFEQLDALLSHTDEARGIEQKSSFAFLRYITDAMASLPLVVADITVFDETVCRGDDLVQMLAPDPHSTTAARIERLQETVTERVGDYFELNEEALTKKMRKASDTVLFDDELPILLLKLRNETIRTMEQHFREDNRLDAVGLYLRFLADFTGDEALTARTKENLEKHFLYYEDLLPVALIRMLLGEGSTFPQIVHLIVDEAQDLGAFSHALIRQLFPKSRFTVLADPSQRIARDGVDEETLRLLYPKALVQPLRKSYRSTGPISAYSQEFLPENLRFEYFAREGTPPKHLTGDPVKAIRRVVEREMAEGCRSLCVLTRTLAETKALAPRLSALIPIVDSNQTLPQKPVLMPLMFAKGLEFDAVVSIDDGCGDGQSHYVMATRALHRLYLADIPAEQNV